MKRIDQSEIAQESLTNEWVAIVGMGCRFPGAGNVREFWRLLEEGRDAISDIPDDRPELKALYDPAPGTPGKIISPQGGFLKNIDKFDPYFFDISPREASVLDPQQRLLLETAWEAFEDAGVPPQSVRGKKGGVFIGMWTNEYEDRIIEATDNIDLYVTTGGGRYSASGRLSFAFDLRGPSMTLDTACSSSLVAIHLACKSLRDGECELALAGGVNLILHPFISIGYSKSKILSSYGRCRFGDAEAGGYVRSEGAGVILLKPLEKALADNDPIYAVIRGSAVNNDGCSSGLLVAPGAATQEVMLRRAYAQAGVPGNQVQYIEAHGTGTKAGDPTEMGALNAVLGEKRDPQQPFFIGSVKTNIGHTEAASGIAGVIKTCLALKNRTIPKNLHFENPSPDIPWQEMALRIPTQTEPFVGDPQEIFAGVNSFGITGTNAHVILQAAPFDSDQSSVESRDAEKLNTENCILKTGLLPLSAHTPEALNALARDFADFIKSEIRDDDALQNLFYTASTRRNHHRHRLAAVAKNKKNLLDKLVAFGADEQAPSVVQGEAELERGHKIVFVFPGQGGQWSGMARELLRQEPVFRESMEKCEIMLKKFVDWSLLEQLQLEKEQSRLNEIDVIQPTLFSIYVSLAALWKSWGITPDAVVGHSMGETAAAAVSGGLSLENAAKIICRRSKLLRRTSGKGAMAVVELSLTEAVHALKGVEEKLSVAVSNSSRSTVIAGDPDELDKLLEKLDRDGVFCRKIKVDVASHSPQMDALKDDLLAALDGLQPQKAAIPMYSTVLTKVIDGTELNAEYWVNNLRQPVLLSKVINQLADDGHDIFIELSPHPVLLPSVQQELQERAAPCITLASMRREEPEQEIMLTALASLYVAGRELDWNVLYPIPGKVIPLPLYPWQRERFWFDDQIVAKGKKKTSRNGKLQHPFLDFYIQAGHQRGAHVWQAEISTGYFPYLADHRVRDAIVFPAAGFVELALAGARELFKENAFALENLALEKALFLPENAEESVQLQLVIRKSENSANFLILSQLQDAEGADWETHARGKINLYKDVKSPKCHSGGIYAIESTEGESRNNDSVPHDCHSGGIHSAKITESPNPTKRPGNLETLKSKSKNHHSKTDHYQSMRRRDLPYGAHFQTINQIWQNDDASLAEITLTESPRNDLSQYLAHPVALDAAFQLLEACVPVDQNGYRAEDPYLPVKLKNCRVFRAINPKQALFATLQNLKFSEEPGASVTGDVFLVSENGDLLLEARGLTLERLARDERHTLASLQYQIEWLEKPRVEDASISPLEGGQGGVNNVGATSKSGDLSPDAKSSEFSLHQAASQTSAEGASNSPLEGGQGGVNTVGATSESRDLSQGVKNTLKRELHTSETVYFIFKNNHRASDQLLQKLNDNAPNVITITAGNEFKRTNENFEINPANFDDWQRLTATIFTENPTSRLETLFLWPLQENKNAAPDSAEIWQAQQHGAESVLLLTQALANLKTPPEMRLWLVTNGAQIVSEESGDYSLEHAPLWGFGAVIVNEHPELNCKRIDLSAKPDETEIASFLQEIDSEENEEQIALRGEKRFVARLVQKPVEAPKIASESENRIPANGRPFRANISTPGVIDNLHMQAFAPREPGADEVQIESRTAGLNFLNIMSALGIYPGYENGVGPLGLECAGVVTKVGGNVKTVQPGDDVLAYALHCMATHATTHAALVMPKPKNLSFEHAATIPAVFLTAYYGLNKLAHLQKGERVLIHSATGGVGLAAIQLAKRAGAEIFATAGTPEKREYLQSLGIKYIMSSRSLDFAEQVLEITDGEGVDVVLNSLSGEAIAAGLAILRPYGRFLEIGKTDIYADSEIGLAPFKKSLSYFTIDFERMPRERPEYVGQMLAEIVELFKKGDLEPPPIKTYAAENISEAFRFMAQAKHIGKLAVSFENKNIDIAPDPAQRFGEGSWLITGGLGALGLKTAEWLVENGARHLALTSRREPSDAAKQKIVALEASGAKIEIVQADVADEAQVAALLGRIRETLPPLKGVIHAAGLLADSTIAQMDVERFREAMRPKVLGAWNLHRQTQNDPLEYFVLFSSATAILGSAGQSNYAAANAFMDALTQHRRANDLPGLSVNWGTWSDIGLAAAQENRGERLEDRGLGSISPEEGVKSLALLLENEAVQAGVMRFDAAKWSAFYTAAQDAPFFSQLEKTEIAPEAGQEGGADEKMPQQLQNEAPGRKRRKFLEDHLRQQISKVLKIAPDRIKRTSPLKTLGLDSLMALELRNRLEASLEIKMRATIFWNFPTLTVLAPELAKLMEIPLEETAPATRQPKPQNGLPNADVPDDDLADLLAEIEDLSDEEAQELLD